MNTVPTADAGREIIQSLTEATAFAANGIVSRTLLRTGNLKIVLFCFDQGQEMAEHTSTQAAVVQVLSGECELILGGKVHRARAGDMVYMPPNLPHALKATGRFSMLLTLSKPGTQYSEP